MTGRAQATMFKDIFKQNYAEYGSAIYFIDTSSDEPFEIDGAKFQENSAVSSTIMLTKSDGTLKNCKLIDNEATKQTQNVFVSMSEVNIETCRFEDNNYRLSQKSASSVSTEGNFLHILLQVTMRVSDTYFYNGFSKNGGAVFL